MTEQPNILFIMTDQQRSDTIAALWATAQIRTPTLDALVDGRHRLHAIAYTPAPVCVAARSATITGVPPHLNGCASNNASPLEMRSIMQALQDLGLSDARNRQDALSIRRSLRPGASTSRDISEEGARSPGSRNDFHRLSERATASIMCWSRRAYAARLYYIPQPSQLPTRHHHTTWVADRAIDFPERRAVNREPGGSEPTRPFFLWTSFIKPHPPFEAPTPWNKLYRAADMLPPRRPQGFERLLTYWNHHQNRYKYRDKGYDEMLFRAMKAMYYACISFIDFNLGRILAALGDDIDKTLILYTSDHGEMLGDFGSVGKRAMLNPAVKVPLIVRPPGAGRGSQRIDTPVSLLDIFPTFASAAGANAPLPSAEGADLLALAAGDSQRDAVYSQFSEGNTGLYMIAERDFKYIYSAADHKEWLFDLRIDPDETKNFAGNPRYEAQLAELRRRIIERFESDGYDRAVNDGAWHDYEPPAFPDPAGDEGLLSRTRPICRNCCAGSVPATRLD